MNVLLTAGDFCCIFDIDKFASGITKAITFYTQDKERDRTLGIEHIKGFNKAKIA